MRGGDPTGKVRDRANAMSNTLLPSTTGALGKRTEEATGGTPDAIAGFFGATASVLCFHATQLSFEEFFSCAYFFLFGVHLFFASTVVSCDVRGSVI